jgi:spore maturation protein CgeB
MKLNKKILYYGQITWGSTSLQRYNALSNIFFSSYPVDSRRAFPDKKSGRSIFKSIQGRLGLGPIISITKNILLQEVNRFNPDIVWIDGGFLVNQETIIELKKLNITVIHYTPDSILAPGMSNLCFRKAIKEYNYVVTTKTQDLNLYKKNKAKNIIFSQQGYDPKIHKQMHLTKDDLRKFSSDVVFIGHCMKCRLEQIEHLNRELNIDIKIFGTGWDNKDISQDTKSCFHGPAIDLNYAKAISGSKICLGLLNHEAKDEITTRSFEIPGCGGFLLAERTKQHLEVFKENIDAAYFSSKEELVEKVKYYLENKDERMVIKNNGHSIVKKGMYSWPSLMSDVIKNLNLEN